MTSESASDLVAPLLRWLAVQPEPVDLHLVCPDWLDRVPIPRSSFAVRTETCARRLPVSAYLELMLAGARSLTVHAGTCGCGGPPGTEELEDARTLLRAAGRGETIATTTARPELPRRRRRDAGAPPTPRQLPVPRRTLLTMAGARARLASASRPAGERERLRDVLLALGLPIPDPERPLVSLPPPSARLTVIGCTACGVCVRACPADALSLSRPVGDGADTTRVLRQDLLACTDCRRCVELCPEQAITTTGRHAWDALLGAASPQLARCTTRRCRRCRSASVSSGDQDLCPVCAYRREHPFGSAPDRTRSAVVGESST